MKIYRIAKWQETFETADSKRYRGLPWVSLPTNMGSNGYQSLLDEFGDDAATYYGAWCALVCAASQAPERGVLASSRKIGYSLGRVSRITGMPAKVFERLYEWALNESVGWLEVVEQEAGDAAEDRATASMAEDSNESEPGDGQPDATQLSPNSQPDATQPSPNSRPEANQAAVGLRNHTKQNHTQRNDSSSPFENDGDDQSEPLQKSETKPADVVDAWNASKAPTRVKRLTTDRMRKLQTRLNNPDWPWREAIERLPIPNDDRFTWQPDFDWLIKNETNAVAICEGKFDRDGPSQSDSRKRRHKLSEILNT